MVKHMRIIVCVEDRNGMLFNNRRVSKDQAVISDIAGYTKRIMVHPFSEKLFDDVDMDVCAEEFFLRHAQQGAYCFVENQKLSPYADKIEAIILYRWNRRYPADFFFDFNLEAWEISEQTEMEGKSHEKITKEIYVRKNR